MSTYNLYKIILFTYLAVGALQVVAQEHPVRSRISLKGPWTFQLDPAHIGIAQHWQDSTFNDEVKLPGTLEENKKGRYVTQPSSQFLNQTYQYEGAAWFKKEIEVPASWKNRQVELYLERTKATRIWIVIPPVCNNK